jgi:ubiquinone/menaquinone biosynthesis C-methylase UbiE
MDEQSKSGHSEKHFTEDRNHWYNPDFFELMARRWGLNQYTSLLDIGAGMCHWSKLLVPYMKPDAAVIAMDNDKKWSKGSEEIEQYFQNLGASIKFVKGDAHHLPFEDDSFEVVTCQTVLIHLKNPDQALREMKRVVKPDGIVICAEPNNRVQALIQDTSNKDDNIEEILERVKQNLAWEKQKIQEQRGNSSFGDLLTGNMNALGFTDLQAYLNDKLVSIYPPYETAEQQAKINSFLNWGSSASSKLAFERAYQSTLNQKGYSHFLKNLQTMNLENKVIRSIRNHTYASGGASLLYLISGKKP